MFGSGRRGRGVYLYPWGIHPIGACALRHVRAETSCGVFQMF